MFFCDLSVSLLQYVIISLNICYLFGAWIGHNFPIILINSGAIQKLICFSLFVCRLYHSWHLRFSCDCCYCVLYKCAYCCCCCCCNTSITLTSQSVRMLNYCSYCALVWWIHVVVECLFLFVICSLFFCWKKYISLLLLFNPAMCHQWMPTALILSTARHCAHYRQIFIL